MTYGRAHISFRALVLRLLNKANTSDVESPFLDLHVFLMILFLTKFTINVKVANHVVCLMGFTDFTNQ